MDRIIADYALYLNHICLEVGTEEECLKRYNYQLEKWEKEFANKEIDRNDTLCLKNVYENYVVKQTTIIKHLL